jgi:hypothetical protein
MRKLLILIFIILPFNILITAAQDIISAGSISGNFQLEAQSYQADSIIGAPKVNEQMLSNGYFNLIYRSTSIEVGMRYENYLNPILGYDPRYRGQGISYRYASYFSEVIDITVGDFYEQFGSGIIFRAYEERALGFDNAVDGMRFKLKPLKGVELTGLIGKQRYFWDKGEGIVRAGNLNITLNDILQLSEGDITYTLGASAVSRFQKDNDPVYRLPENVFAYSGRFGLTSSSFAFDAEYGYKYNDPNTGNKYNYNPGTALNVTASYFGEGFGFSLNAHRLDNMDFRGDRNARANELTINFIPPISKQHVYALAAVYPYATKLNGEAGIQADVTFKIPKNTFFGDKYGTDINLNFSAIKSIDTTHIDEFTYNSPLFSIGNRLYFRDFNIDISKKLSNVFKLGMTYLNIYYDKDILENEGSPLYGAVNSNVIVIDGTYNISDEHSIRVELQHLWAKQDSAIIEPDNINGNWAHILMEYTIAPNWFITLYDQYNYGNNDTSRQVHYPNASVAYFTGATRVQMGYGRQRGGIICVGGICRAVPASNGIFLSVSSSF